MSAGKFIGPLGISRCGFLPVSEGPFQKTANDWMGAEQQIGNVLLTDRGS